MTWRANRIYVDGAPQVLARLRAEPSLVGHVYLLTGSLPASTEPDADTTRLPDGGLVVVKEVAAPDVPAAAAQQAALLAMFGEPPRAAGPAHHWYDADEFASWHALRGPLEASDESAYAKVHELSLDEVPPAAFLGFLDELHRSTGAVVSYYACETWGGAVELEFAWVFGERRRAYVHRSAEGTVEIDDEGRHLRDAEILTLVLAHHGVRSATGWFAPHTRSFEWAPFAVR
jgi:hypothetical protein